ncbi:MAG TPA: GtrA family protein [Caulobacteraceae bacterium]
MGAINTAFGFGLYALLVFVGLNLFVAQIIAHVTGATFNYFMFRRHVFRNMDHPIGRYGLSYVFNYLVSVSCLAILHIFIRSPYLAGLGTIVTTAMLNFFVLKFFVFRPTRASAS